MQKQRPGEAEPEPEAEPAAEREPVTEPEPVKQVASVVIERHLCQV